MALQITGDGCTLRRSSSGKPTVSDPSEGLLELIELELIEGGRHAHLLENAAELLHIGIVGAIEIEARQEPIMNVLGSNEPPVQDSLQGIDDCLVHGLSSRGRSLRSIVIIGQGGAAKKWKPKSSVTLLEVLN